MRVEANKYLFFYKDAKDAENAYLEQHKDKGFVSFLRTEFNLYKKGRFMYEIVDMHTKFDEDDNPFTLITYIDEYGKIRYTKFNEEIHRIEIK